MVRMSEADVPRPSLDETLLHCAFAWSMRGTCSRKHNAAVFAVDGRIVSTGYNGAPRGMTHCDHRTYEVASAARPDWVIEWLRARGDDAPPLGDLGSTVWYDNGTVTYGARPSATCPNAVHAEANAVAFAARHGVSLIDSTLYTTTMPCLACAQLVVNVGTVRVVAAEWYRDDSGYTLLAAAGVVVSVAGPVPDAVHD